MGNHHGDKWRRALPWVLLGKRVQFQPDLDASAALLAFGRSPLIPGQLLGEAGPPLTSLQTRALLEELYRLEANPAKQTSSVPDIRDMDTDDITHVYCKVEEPSGLAPRFEGPFKVISRPSRSQVQVTVGSYANGTPRLSTYNWSSCKPAFLRSPEVEAERPMLGRRPNRPHPSTSEDTLTQMSTNVQPVESKQSEPAKIQQPVEYSSDAEPIESSRPVRSSRNPNPRYIDSLIHAA